MAHDLPETHGLVMLEEHLALTYATLVGRAAVHQAVRTAYRQFDGAPIRDYVVVLVEREARARLAALGAGQRLTAEECA